MEYTHGIILCFILPITYKDFIIMEGTAHFIGHPLLLLKTSIAIDSHTLLLDKRIVADSIHLKAGRQSHRA